MPGGGCSSPRHPPPRPAAGHPGAHWPREHKGPRRAAGGLAGRGLHGAAASVLLGTSWRPGVGAWPLRLGTSARSRAGRRRRGSGTARSRPGPAGRSPELRGSRGRAGRGRPRAARPTPGPAPGPARRRAGRRRPGRRARRRGGGWARRCRNRCQANTAAKGGSPYTSETSQPGGGSSGIAGCSQLSRIDAPAVSPVRVHGYHGTRWDQAWRWRRWRCSARALRAAEAMNASKLDVLVAYDYDLLTPIPSGDLESIHLLDDPVLAAVSPNHRLATVAAWTCPNSPTSAGSRACPAPPSAHWSTAPAAPPASNPPSPTGPASSPSRRPSSPPASESSCSPRSPAATSPTRTTPGYGHPPSSDASTHSCVRLPPPTGGPSHHRPARGHCTRHPAATPTHHRRPLKAAPSSFDGDERDRGRGPQARTPAACRPGGNTG